MLCRMLRIWLLSLALLPSLARAGSPANTVSSVSPANSIDAFSGALREYLVHHLPTVLYESHPGWGHTKAVATGINWTGKGLNSHPHISHGERNDGTWRTVRVTAPNLAQSLTLSFHNIQQPEPGRTTFDVALAFDAHVDCEQQNWKSGVRLYSGSARARLRVSLLLACEATSRVEWHKGLLPEAVFRLRVVKANTSYERFVLEHVAGVGGAAAKLIGDAVREGIHKWRPALERNLLVRANVAIEKAGDSREVRIGLGSLLNTKSNPPTTVHSGATILRKG
jgi:hypothetical protein